MSTSSSDPSSSSPSPLSGQTLSHTDFGSEVLAKIPAVEDLVLRKARGMLSKWASMVRGRVDVGLAVARKRGEGWRGVTKGDWRRGLGRIKVRRDAIEERYEGRSLTLIETTNTKRNSTGKTNMQTKLPHPPTVSG